VQTRSAASIVKHQALIQALPDHAARVVCIGVGLDTVTDDIRRVAGDAQITSWDLDSDELPSCLPLASGSIHAVLIHGILRRTGRDELGQLFAECHRVLGDHGRVVVRDNLPSYDHYSPRIGRLLLRAAGVRYTSNEVFALMERAGFWECLVLRGASRSRDVVVKGDKVVQRASLDGTTDTPDSTISLVK
jgi:hypothetical protein